jgi:tetratricopeptide (TPR) repeat protein
MKFDDLDFEIDFYERLIKTNPDYVEALIPLAEAYTQKGRIHEGLEIDKRLSRLREDDPVVHYNLACSYALVGEKEAALAALRMAVSLGYDDWKHLVKDPDLKSLHDDAAFKALLRDASGKANSSTA